MNHAQKSTKLSVSLKHANALFTWWPGTILGIQKMKYCQSNLCKN